MEHVGRSIEPFVKEFVLPTFSAVLVTGPRAVGKTTSMRDLTRVHLDLSIPGVRDGVAADPDAALTGLERPVLIDEWQEVPEVVSAVKRAVDRDPSPGQFVLTGSVRGPLEAATWGGTGRLIRTRMFGLSQAEVEATGVNPIDVVFEEPEVLAGRGMADLDRNDYLDRVVGGGFPAAFRLGPRERATWYRSYASQLIERDAVAVGGVREPKKLKTVLSVVAARSAQEQAMERMCQEAGVARTTLYAHLDLLENLQVLWRLPAWAPNRLRRLIRSPKLHLTDSGLAASVLGVNAEALRFDGRLAGSLLESFVARELLTYAQTAVTPVDLFHLRTQAGHEVDVVAVSDDGRVVGFEIKAGANVGPRDARGLRWLRDQLGELFTGGFVLHTGPLGHPVDERVWAVPVASLWRASVPSGR